MARLRHTSLIIEPLLKFFFPDMSGASREFVHACVRKSAHFTEYGILALLGIRALFQTSGALFRLRWVLPIAIVAAVASLDEFNQSFEPTRTSSPWDVLLDCFGGASAALAFYAIWRVKYDRQTTPIGSRPLNTPGGQFYIRAT